MSHETGVPARIRATVAVAVMLGLAGCGIIKSNAQRGAEMHEQMQREQRALALESIDQQLATLERQRPYLTPEQYQIHKIQLEDQRKAWERQQVTRQ